MARPFVRLAPLAALAALLGAPLAAAAQSPNVDSLVEQALTKNAGAQDGLLIARAMTDTGVQRAMESDPKARSEIRTAVHQLERHRDGDTGEQARARERFVAAIKQATGRDISGPTQYGMIHTPRIDVHVPGINIHMDGDSVRVPAPPAPPAPPGVPAVPPLPAGLVLTDSLKALVERARHDPGVATLPPIEDFTAGPRDVTGVNHGSVATVEGPLTVSGVVDGDVAAVEGDVIILPGAVVHGNATAVGGEVHQGGGIVQGEIRSTSGKIGPVAHVMAHTPRTARHEFRLSLACLALMLIIGIGILTFASEPLDAAAQAVSDQFGRALGYGIIGALAVVPLLVVLLVAAILTLIGILFTPVIVVAYSLVVLGIILVGFFAVAETTGRAVYRRRQAMDPLSERGAKLRAIVTGIAIYGGMWVIAAILGGLPVVGVVLHVLASAITTIIILVGCGAVLVSRRDARTVATIRAQTGAPASPVPDLLWQTPTPVGGVAAARRPTPPPPTSGPVT
jgi:hypothetical protein